MAILSDQLNQDLVKKLYKNAELPTEKIDNKSKRDKYLPYKQLLESHKPLQEKIAEVFSSIPSVPAIHITSSAFINGDEISDSEFIRNIKESGFRSQDTNIGVLMVREGKREIAKPQEFVIHPEKFLRELDTLIRHYYHHGTRANKNILPSEMKNARGIACMLLVDISDSPLEAGSDYEDHYKLGSSISGRAVVGEIDLDSRGTTLGQELPRIANEFLEKTKLYYLNKKETPQEQ